MGRYFSSSNSRPSSDNRGELCCRLVRKEDVPPRSGKLRSKSPDMPEALSPCTVAVFSCSDPDHSACASSLVPTILLPLRCWPLKVKQRSTRGKDPGDWTDAAPRESPEPASSLSELGVAKPATVCALVSTSSECFTVSRKDVVCETVRVRTPDEVAWTLCRTGLLLPLSGEEAMGRPFCAVTARLLRDELLLSSCLNVVSARPWPSEYRSSGAPFSEGRVSGRAPRLGLAVTRRLGLLPVPVSRPLGLGVADVRRRV